MHSLPRASRAVWIAAIGLWLLFLAFVGLHLVTPSDGARLAPGEAQAPEAGLRLEPLVPSALQPGDLLLAVDGRSVAALARALTGPWPANPPFAFGQAVTYTVARAGQPRDVRLTLGRYPLGAVLAANWGSIISALLIQLSTALVFVRRPAEPVARALFLAAAGMAAATSWSLGLQVSDLAGGLGFWLFSLSVIFAYMLLWSGALHATLLFPTPWLPLARRRWLVVALYAAPYALLGLVTALARAPNALAWEQQMGAVTGYVQGAYALLALAAAARGYRSARDPVSRAQVRWVTTAFAITFLSGFTFGVLPQLVLGYPLLSWDTLALVGLLVPLAFGVAILRYRLFDIDLLLNRTLVYGALTTLVVGAYVLLVGGLSTLLHSSHPLAPLLLTAAMALVAAQPLRARLQGGVNRLMFGAAGAPAPAPPQAPPAPRPPATGPLPAPPAPAAEPPPDAPAEAAPARLGAWGFVFRGLAAAAVVEVAGLVLNLSATPNGQGLIGQGLFTRVWLGLVVVPLILLLGALIIWRVPANLTGRFLILVAVGAISMQFDFNWGPPAVAALAAVAVEIFATGVVGPGLAYVMLTFPSGRVYPPAWARLFVVAGGVKLIGAVLEILATPGKVRIFTPMLNPVFVPALAPYRGVLAATIGITGLLLPLMVFAGVLSLLLRYRAAPALVRQQIKWVIWGFGLMVPTGGVTFIIAFVYGAASPAFQASLFFAAAGQVALLSALAIAVLRYRLFDIDVLINRTLVYGSLTVIVVGVYVLAVGYLSELFQASGSFILSLLATGLIAVFFQPLRERVQRFVNRLLYGERDDPYAVLSSLGQRLEATLAPEAVLPALVETIAQTLKLPYVAVALHAASEREPQIAAAYGLPSAQLARLPLTYQAERVGELLIAPRGPGESFTPAEQRLLADIARQAGVAAHAVRLTADLQRSRERLVSALEEERRRLRRDLHDGLGPQLASQTLTLTAARQLLAQRPAEADALLAEAIKHAQAAVSDIRRVVYDLRPPALDDLGLAGALRAQVAEFGASGVRFVVSVPEHLPPLPAAVEVACYRVAQEALTNVVKHAQAHACALTVTVEAAGGAVAAVAAAAVEAAPGAVVLEVTDDGRGLPAERRAGVGLGSMRERAAELGGQCSIEPGPGGGTRVLARLPLG